MSILHNFTVQLLVQPDGGYTVFVPALPEAVTEGDTREEAIANAKDAIALVLEMYRAERMEVPVDLPVESVSLTIAA